MRRHAQDVQPHLAATHVALQQQVAGAGVHAEETRVVGGGAGVDEDGVLAGVTVRGSDPRDGRAQREGVWDGQAVVHLHHTQSCLPHTFLTTTCPHTLSSSHLSNHHLSAHTCLPHTSLTTTCPRTGTAGTWEVGEVGFFVLHCPLWEILVALPG